MFAAKPTNPAAALERLLVVMARLRDPEKGCPWDVKQTMQSLTRYTIEEAYEAVDAIERGAPEEIKDELGDLLFQIVFYAQVGKEQDSFDFTDIANAISDKMVRRHPHVFADRQTDESQLSTQWEAIKATEKTAQSNALLDSVPRGLPALMYAQKIQKKCATVGFDWPSVTPVADKVREEVAEIQAELDAPERDQQALEAEIGDALFAMVNLARHCNVDADAALRRASQKFARRFATVEAMAIGQKGSLTGHSLDELEQLWQQVKSQE
ncbi:nucleoside triphosphate pyrophosphohydrolase [Alteromonas lipolytica]|uniref:Nucleoside triphosphate pyrophosphohydrolase n=1 Tax=Alteromonas lipolytica TaxID=1856405 RepID=A0A1E8FCW8_9ALTE|nr:nucleoside triphosphate pyrophosphohydrolase [Alteromonas lipolytica]OFI33770.1 nucleoside triphosphate pyrophosphohydrolase [Alteromonas lipolytica]GGF68535.1 nucleoside triphosphate pyrophosphohydrolase [Alteromonas lipolytica]